MRLRSLVPLTLACASVGFAPPARAQVLPHAPVVDHLENGLTVVTIPFDAPGIATYFTLVRAGSRDEVERGHSGFAHLFEHMMFRGSEHYTADEYEHRMQALGADNNAYTTSDFTLFTVTLPAASLANLVPIEADRFEHLSYSQPTFQTETRAVLGEYNKNSANPLEQMWETLSEMAFTRHTYGHTTMGYLRDIEAMPNEYRYSQGFFRRFYSPDDCTILVAGDVQHDAVLSLIRQSYGTWTGHRAQPRIAPEPEQTTPRVRVLAWEGTSPSRMLIGFRIPGFDLNTPDTVALEVVHALAFSQSSDLYQRLVVREQKLLGLESWRSDFHRDPGLFVVELKLANGTGFDEMLQAVTDTLASVGRGEFAHDRFEAVLSNLRYSLPMSIQTPSDAAEAVARFMALTGDVSTLENYAQRLGTVTADDVARVTHTYLVPARRTSVMLAQADHAPPDAVHVGPRVSAQSTHGSSTARPGTPPSRPRRASPPPAAATPRR